MVMMGRRLAQMQHYVQQLHTDTGLDEAHIEPRDIYSVAQMN